MNEEQFERFMGLMACIQSDIQKISVELKNIRTQLNSWDQEGHSSLSIYN